MIKRLATLFVFSALVAATAAQADTQAMPFSYRVKVPAGSASCADHASAVAASFAAGTRTKSKSVTGACESRQTLVDQNAQFAIDVIDINYSAENELVPFRTVYGSDAFQNSGRQEAGVFKTYSECLHQLSVQQAIFAKETGVTPLAGYCTASTQQEFYPGFSLTFESFGDLKARLYTFSEDGIGLPSDDHTQVIRAAVFAIQTAGGHIAWSDDSRVFYYNDGDVNVANDNLGMFEVASQCTSQVAQAQSIYVAAGLVGVTAFCRMDTPVAGHGFAVLMVVGAGSDELSDMDTDRYATFDECMGDLNRVLKNAASNGRTVLGGLCSPNLSGDEGFNAHVYSSM
jgi:hypothetical protein